MAGDGASRRPVPAVVLGGTGAALSITRSLGRAGIPVHVLGTDGTSLARASRYCTSFTAVGTGDAVEDRWMEWLEERGPEGAVVLPTADIGVELVVRQEDRLRELGYRLLDYAGETSLAMLDKERTYELARAADVDCPRTWTVADDLDLEVVRDELSYPCALKPIQSHQFAEHFGSTKVLMAHDHAELSAGLARARAAGVDMMVTEIIPGGDDCNWAFRTYLDAHGSPLFRVTTQRLRSHPIHFGTNCYLMTASDPEVAEVGLRFMQAVGLRGLAYTELKRDPRDGRLKLIECNHRFGAAQEVVRRAGIDVVLMAYRIAIGEHVEPVREWREGVRLWFPLRDARAARDYRQAGELSWPRWAASVLRGRPYTPVFAFDDPRPTLRDATVRLRRQLAGTTKRPAPAAPAGTGRSGSAR